MRSPRSWQTIRRRSARHSASSAPWCGSSSFARRRCLTWTMRWCWRNCGSIRAHVWRRSVRRWDAWWHRSTPADIAATLDRFRTRQALLRAVRIWTRGCSDNALDVAGLERLLHREARWKRRRNRAARHWQRRCWSICGWPGQFAPLLARARAKQQALVSRAHMPPAGPALAAVLDWYFSARLGELPPRSIGRLGARRRVGPANQVFTQAVWRDYLFAEAQR